MRATEFLPEAGKTVVTTEPWDAEADAKWKEGSFMADLKLPNGTLPPEITALKTPGGTYDLSRIPYNFGETLLKKYGSLALERYRKPGPYDTAFDEELRQKAFRAVQDRIVNALQSANEFATPRSRFFYPNRPAADNSLNGFRGTAKGVENTAKKFDPADLQFYLGAFKWARDKRLVDPITPDQWLMILLTEGRDDFGFNDGQWAQQAGPADKQFEASLEKMGIVNRTQRGFIALIRSKQSTVKRTGIPFYQAWNGGGANLGNYNAQVAAVKDPRNKPLLDLIATALA